MEQARGLGHRRPALPVHEGVPCPGLRLHGLVAGLHAGDGLLRHLDGSGHELLRSLLLPGDHVAAMAADGREHLVEHPSLETLGVGELGVGDEAVDVALGDEAHLLFLSSLVNDGVAKCDTV